jgi:hypothetical protein
MSKIAGALVMAAAVAVMVLNKAAVQQVMHAMWLVHTPAAVSVAVGSCVAAVQAGVAGVVAGALLFVASGASAAWLPGRAAAPLRCVRCRSALSAVARCVRPVAPLPSLHAAVPGLLSAVALAASLMAYVSLSLSVRGCFSFVLTACCDRVCAKSDGFACGNRGSGQESSSRVGGGDRVWGASRECHAATASDAERGGGQQRSARDAPAATGCDVRHGIVILSRVCERHIAAVTGQCRRRLMVCDAASRRTTCMLLVGY